MKLIDLIEILTKLEKTDLNRYADIVVMVNDEVVDLADASIGYIDDNIGDKVLVLYTESNNDTH
jgi:hypothetical protein